MFRLKFTTAEKIEEYLVVNPFSRPYDERRIYACNPLDRDGREIYEYHEADTIEEMRASWADSFLAQRYDKFDCECMDEAGEEYVNGPRDPEFAEALAELAEKRGPYIVVTQQEGDSETYLIDKIAGERAIIEYYADEYARAIEATYTIDEVHNTLEDGFYKGRVFDQGPIYYHDYDKDGPFCYPGLEMRVFAVRDGKVYEEANAVGIPLDAALCEVNYQLDLDLHSRACRDWAAQFIGHHQASLMFRPTYFSDTYSGQPSQLSQRGCKDTARAKLAMEAGEADEAKLEAIITEDHRARHRKALVEGPGWFAGLWNSLSVEAA